MASGAHVAGSGGGGGVCGKPAAPCVGKPDDAPCCVVRLGAVLAVAMVCGASRHRNQAVFILPSSSLAPSSFFFLSFSTSIPPLPARPGQSSPAERLAAEVSPRASSLRSSPHARTIVSTPKEDATPQEAHGRGGRGIPMGSGVPQVVRRGHACGLLLRRLHCVCIHHFGPALTPACSPFLARTSHSTRRHSRRQPDETCLE